MRKQKILAVEDSKTIQSIYQDTLGKHYELRLLGEGENATSTAVSFRPDLIILDIHLPDVSGIDICKRLAKMDETTNIPVIMVTSDTSVEVLKEAYYAGALDYIHKPFNKIELLIRVQNLLKLVSTYEQNCRLREDSAVEDMGRSVAHHVNQPLTTILGAAEMLEIYRDKLEAEIVELLDMIINGSRQLAQIIQKIENAKTYKTDKYLDDIRIVDFD